jgi:hypothetical protein
MNLVLETDNWNEAFATALRDLGEAFTDALRDDVEAGKLREYSEIEKKAWMVITVAAGLGHLPSTGQAGAPTLAEAS